MKITWRRAFGGKTIISPTKKRCQDNCSPNFQRNSLPTGHYQVEKSLTISQILFEILYLLSGRFVRGVKLHQDDHLLDNKGITQITFFCKRSSYDSGNAQPTITAGDHA